jgi:hypothetical protein
VFTSFVRIPPFEKFARSGRDKRDESGKRTGHSTSLTRWRADDKWTASQGAAKRESAVTAARSAAAYSASARSTGGADNMPSDAWATGQALYALAHAKITPDESAVMRGRSFLIAAQRDDGSWPMTSRPTKPGGEGSTSLIPITGGGSAWAVLGLVRNQ